MGSVIINYLDRQCIADRVKALAEEIDEHYNSSNVSDILVIGILKGSFVFMSDLIRELKTNCKMDFLQVSSYVGTDSTGNLQIIKDLTTDISGRHVLVIEDIIDTGNTLKHVIEMLWEREPASIKLCALLDKPERRTVRFEGDFVGFKVPDKFLVGYGLDYNESYRGLPYIGVLSIDT